jgi:transcriptional regulator with XRE-family HTH domain
VTPENEAVEQASRLLGDSLRAARKAKGLTLVELGRLSNLTHGFLSQLERGRVRPGMASMARLSRALDSSQLEILAGYARARSVPFNRDGPFFVATDNSITGEYEGCGGRMLVDSRAQFQPVRASGSSPEFGSYFQHPEDEFCSIVAGDVVVDLDTEGTFELAAGDSLYFFGGTNHRWRSADGAPFEMIVVKQRFP